MEEENTCIVCMEPLQINLGEVKTPCNHTYCMECFIKHMRISSNCAMCRKQLTIEEPVKEDDDETVDYNTDTINGEDIWSIVSNFNRFLPMQHRHNHRDPLIHPTNTPVSHEDHIYNTIDSVNEIFSLGGRHVSNTDILIQLSRHWPFMQPNENMIDFNFDG